MGKRETPAHAQAVLPPRPDAANLPESEPALAEAPPLGERTLLRSKERESSAGVAAAGESEAAEPLASEVVAQESAADSLAAVPEVEPRASEPGAKRSPSVPPLPVAALERPTALRAEPTPSPVPRVSLVPPTGRIDSSQLAELIALESRQLPSVAPQLRPTRLPAELALLTPAQPIPLVLKPRPPGLARRLANDVRSSKREIALGLVIGIVLSFVLGKLGQSYLESRGRGATLDVQSFANQPAAPGATHRSPASGVPASAPAPASPQVVAPRTATPGAATPGAATPSAATPGAATPGAATLGAAAARPGSGAPPGATPAGRTPPRAAPGQRRPEQGARPGKPASRTVPAPAGNEQRAPGGAGAASPAAPPSPAERAGLGLELPL